MIELVETFGTLGTDVIGVMGTISAKDLLIVLGFVVASIIGWRVAKFQSCSSTDSITDKKCDKKWDQIIGEGVNDTDET